MQSPITDSCRVVIVTHELFYGASHALRDYLNSRNVKEAVFISHPIRPENPRSYVQHFAKGRKVSEQSIFRPSGGILWYAVDFFLTIYWVIGQRGTYDVYIGVDPLNCAAGVLLKALGLVKRVVFYSIDFVPQRFSNRLLDAAYHAVESWCVKFSNERWDVSPRITKGREKFLHLPAKTFPTRIVPIGVWGKDIMVEKSHFDPHRFVFAGHLLPKQGVQKVLEALPLVIEKVKGATFLVIGGGEEEDKLQQLAERFGIAKHVTFTGWIKDQDEVRKRLAACAFAVAPYDPEGAEEGNFTYYADPTKIKTYLSCRLPVIMTDVPFNAGDLARRGCAIVVDYDEKSIVKVLIDLLTDKKKLETMRKNSIETAKEFTWEKIFEHVII